MPQALALAELLAAHRSDQPVIELRVGEMANPRYAVEVWPYMLGQFRILLLESSRPDGHGGIVREMCTYQSSTAIKTCLDLSQSPDPEAFCESRARPWNCEGPGQRIRLDNLPTDRPETIKHTGVTAQ